MVEKIQEVSLSEFFKFFRPTHLLGTTYTISLMFFEALIWPNIDKTSLERCLVLCDKSGFQRAGFEAIGLKEASTSYMVAPVPISKTFHPKVWLMANQEQISLLVGSGNLTQSGFITNNELFDVITFDKATVEPLFLEDLHSFLKGLSGCFSYDCENSNWVRQTLAQIIELLPDYDLETTNDWSIRFLHSFQKPFPEQLEMVGQGSELFVASPYFGGSLNGLMLLQDKIKPRKVHIFPAVLSSGGINLPHKKITKSSQATLETLHIGDTARFSHFKLYGMSFESGEGYLFNGSVNCTEAALNADNIEAGLLCKTTAKQVHSIFANRGSFQEISYDPLSFEKSDSHWVVMFANNLGDAFTLHLTSLQKHQHHLRNVKLTLRNGADINSCILEEAFLSHNNKLAISWSHFDNINDSRGCFFIEMEAEDPSGKKICASAFINDLCSLSSNPGHRNAYNAALKLISGESLPSIFDISSVFRFLEDSCLKQELSEPSEQSRKQASNEQPDDNPLPVWPPQAIPARQSAYLTGSDSSITWLQRILSLIFNINEEQGGSIGSDGATGARETGSEGNNKRSKTTYNKLRCTNNWKIIIAQYKKLHDRAFTADLSSSMIQRLLPGLMVGFWMVLGTRRGILELPTEEIPNDLELPGLENLLVNFLDLVLSPRGKRKSLVSSAMEDFKILIQDDFSKVFLLFFAYLYVLNQRVKSSFRNLFPLEAWVTFQDCLQSTTTQYNIDEREFGIIYDNFLNSPETLARESICEGFHNLLLRDWQDLEGITALKYLSNLQNKQIEYKSKDAPKCLRDVEIFWNQIRSGQPVKFLAASKTVRYCEHAGCPDRFIEKPYFRNLDKLVPVICRGCGNVMVPDVIMKLTQG